MLIGDAVRGALPLIQRQAESLMWDQVQIVGRDGTVVADPDPDSFDVDPHETPVYAGKAEIKPRERVVGNELQAGEASDTRTRRVVKVPMTVTGVLPGHIVKVVSCATDPSLVGDELVVQDVEQGTHLSARRITCYSDRRKA